MVTELEGGLTMKMKKMVGAIALTAALAMGTAPAFAASATTDTAFSGSDGSTIIKASVEDSMLKATVPLNVAIVFGAGTGSGTITAPDKSTYAISNTGDGAIKVTEAAIENGSIASLKIAGFGVDGSKSIYGADAATQSASDNYVMLTYDDGTNYTYLAADHPLSDANTGRTAYDTAYDANFKDFNEVEIAAGAKLPIQLGGKTQFGTAVDNTQLTDTLCTIKYTIAKA